MPDDEADGIQPVANRAECSEAIFSIMLALIQFNKCFIPVEELHRAEVDPVFSEVLSTLAFVPFVHLI